MKYENRLRDMRDRARISQDDLASALDTGRSTITKYERGERKIPPQRLQAIAKILKCEPWEILSQNISLSDDEAELVKEYRALDQDRKAQALADMRDRRVASEQKSVL